MKTFDLINGEYMVTGPAIIVDTAGNMENPHVEETTEQYGKKYWYGTDKCN